MADKIISTLDLNTADKDVMVRKLKISPRQADRIIALRPYQSVEQFVEILKIDPSVLRRIRPLVHVAHLERTSELKKEETPISQKSIIPGIQLGALLPSTKIETGIKDLYLFRYVKWVLSFIWLLATIKMAFYAYSQGDLNENTFFVQGLCFLLAIIWLMINSGNIILLLSQLKFNQIKIHPAWLLVLAAIVLRFYALSIFPPANQTGFEEVQTGSAANAIIFNRGLPIEFRFTGILAALGLSTGSTLSSLRFPFQINGIIGLILMVLSLRGLKTSWGPTLLITFIAATMRFLVIASGTADELFASIPILTAFLLCIIKSENTKTNQPFWLGAAGILAGILMFEYTSYRMPVVVFGFWLFWKCIYISKEDKNHAGSSAWFNLLSFVIPLILVTLPTIVQTIRHPELSVFFEAFRRHGIERSSIVSGAYLFELKNQVLGLTGWPSEVSAYYTPVGEPVVLPLAGRLFGISFLFGLFFMSRGIPRVLAITVFLTIISASIFANDVNIGRMSPAFPMLLILSGIFLEKIYQKISLWMENFQHGKVINLLIPNHVLVKQKAPVESESIRVHIFESEKPAQVYYRQVIINMQQAGQFTIKILAAFLFLALISQITFANLYSLKKMSKDPRVINEYINDDYSVCAHIGIVAKLKQRVYIYSPGGFDLCSPVLVEGWYYGSKQLEIYHVFGELTSENLLPGDLVVMGVDNRALTSEEISQLTNFGINTNSLTSLQYSKNFAGRITVGSLCFQCKGP